MGGGEIKKKLMISALLFCLVLPVVYAILHPPWSLVAKLLVVDEKLETANVLIVPSGDWERAIYAAELYKLGWAPEIIMSGCGGMAKKMALTAVKEGVEPKDIILEEHAISTYENALYSRNIVLANNFKSAIIVSSPYHMRRTKLVFGRVFKNTGVKLLYSSTKNSDFNVDGQCKSKVDRAVVIREYLKLIYYWFRYW